MQQRSSAAPHPGVDCRVRPTDAAYSTLSVDISFDAMPPFAELVLAAPSHGGLSNLSIRDAAGPIAFTIAARAGATVVTLSRESNGKLTAQYRVASAPAAFDDPAATTLSTERMRLSGETALLLPSSLDREVIDARVEFQLSFARGGGVASSFGAPHPSHVICRGEELRHATFIAGNVGQAEFATKDGADTWAWLESLGFDPRPVAADAAVLRTEAARYFEAKPLPAFNTLLLANARPDGAFGVFQRSRGLLIQLSVDFGWTAPVRIAMARELFRPWWGGELALASVSGVPSMRDLWFNEGGARYVARELLFRLGMLSPEEYRSEVNAEIAQLATSSFRGAALDGIAKQAATQPTVKQELVARGAVYFTALRGHAARRDGRDPIDSLVRALFALVREQHRVLTTSDWQDLVSKRFDASARRDFELVVGAGEPPKFEPQTLGNCFRLQTTTYTTFALGWKVEETAAGGEITGLEASGPAARAGLRATDRLISVAYRAQDATAPVELDVLRDGRPVHITYLPAGARHTAPGWARRKEVSDDKCL